MRLREEVWKRRFLAVTGLENDISINSVCATAGFDFSHTKTSNGRCEGVHVHVHVYFAQPTRRVATGGDAPHENNTDGANRAPVEARLLWRPRLFISTPPARPPTPSTCLSFNSLGSALGRTPAIQRKGWRPGLAGPRADGGARQPIGSICSPLEPLQRLRARC